MVITFPHMGNVGIAAKTLCQAMGIPYVMPDENSKKTLRLGAYHSPEEICLPFKIMLGNFIESIERGADTVLMVGSGGPCRFGEYCELQMKIIKKLGFENIDFIVVDLSHGVGKEEFLSRIGRIADASPVPRREQFRALLLAYKVVGLCDKVDAKAHCLAGYEKNKGQCKMLLNECKSKAIGSNDPWKTLDILKDYCRRLDRVRLDKGKDPLKVSVIGEIYTIIEPFSNLYIEEKLMDYGVSVTRTLTPSWWMKDMMLKPLKINSHAIHSAGKEYMPFQVGGHGRECVGEAVLAGKHGMDGVIQILPLGCMPEIVAKSILPTIQKDKGIPVLTLIVDELTGEAGYVTRLEAFLDMLESRRKPSPVLTPAAGRLVQ